MYTRKDVEFKVEKNKLTLRGWLYTPIKMQKTPCIIMTHGFSALKEHYLDKFASEFAKNGFSVLVYDNLNFGDSDGNVRFEIDPTAQVCDMRDAVTFVQSLSEVNPEKIGIWGTSFSGGNVLVLAATDKRISCVVAQVPFVSGRYKALKQNRPELWDTKNKMHNDDKMNRAQGKPAATIEVVADGDNKWAIMDLESASIFFKSVPQWENKVTLRSIENAGNYEPIEYIKLISPIPLLFIVANKDTINTTDLALKAYSEALEPKKLVMIEGNHFSPYVEQFDICANAACDWFIKFLVECNQYIKDEIKQ